MRVERTYHFDDRDTVWVMRLDGDSGLGPMTSYPHQLHTSPEAAEEYYRPQKEALFGPVLKDMEMLGISI